MRSSDKSAPCPSWATDPQIQNQFMLLPYITVGTNYGSRSVQVKYGEQQVTQKPLDAQIDNSFPSNSIINLYILRIFGGDLEETHTWTLSRL